MIENNKSYDQASRKRVAKYAEDGISFAEHFKRRCTEEGGSASVTPIAITEPENFVFVKDSINKNLKQDRSGETERRIENERLRLEQLRRARSSSNTSK